MSFLRDLDLAVAVQRLGDQVEAPVGVRPPTELEIPAHKPRVESVLVIVPRGEPRAADLDVSVLREGPEERDPSGPADVGHAFAAVRVVFLRFRGVMSGYLEEVATERAKESVTALSPRA